MANKKPELLLVQSILTLFLLSLFIPLSQADVTLTVREGSGFPGSTGNPVAVSLDNQNDEVRGVQIDVCDVDDYLSCTACETTGRTASFDCMTNEIEGGCCRVLLVALASSLVEEGTGPIFTIEYDVTENAPEEECRTLNPENVKISDVNLQPLDVTSEAGEFCFVTSPITTTTTSITTTTTTTKCACVTQEIYGKNSEEVELLRNFRDRVLSKTQSGRELIRLYYQLSPALVKLLEEDELLREQLSRLYYQLSPTIIKVLEGDESFREGLIALYYQWWGPAVIKAIEEDKVFRKEVKELIDKTLPLIKGEAE